MLRVIQMGLGPIGRAIAEQARRHPGLELVGAVDTDPAIVGRDLGGISISADAVALVRQVRPDLVLHATGSFLDDVAAQLRDLLREGTSVLSTCEELAYPYYRHPRLTRELDREARAGGTVLLGCGVNPGFVMDKLVATLLAGCVSVESVRVRRVVDAATRREPFQRKIGAGLSREAFEQRLAGGRMGHIGLAESAHMLADLLGLPRDREIEQSLRPVVLDEPVESAFIRVEPGQVAGIDQTLRVLAGGTTRVRMELQMYLGAERPHDAVSVTGNPPLEMEIPSGVAGDIGTAAVTANCAPAVPGLTPGLRTVLDLPLGYTFGDCG